MRKVALALILFTSLAGAAGAQIVPPFNSKPEAYAKPTRVPEARDVPYPGTIQLTVDATDVTRGIFKVHEHVPVSGAGDFVMSATVKDGTSYGVTVVDPNNGLSCTIANGTGVMHEAPVTNLLVTCVPK